MKNFVTLNQKWEQDQYAPKAANTLFQNGGFISYDGSGHTIPSTAGIPILGLGQEDVLASDVDYTSNRLCAYQECGPNIYFTIVVTNGTATSGMVGKVFNLDTPESLDVSAYITIAYDTLAVSTFTVGHTVTGGTSGATGVISLVNTGVNPNQLVLTTVTGTFVDGETITDGTSSATAKIRQIFANGTQIEITKFISATLVEGKVALFS